MLIGFSAQSDSCHCAGAGSRFAGCVPLTLMRRTIGSHQENDNIAAAAGSIAKLNVGPRLALGEPFPAAGDVVTRELRSRIRMSISDRIAGRGV